ncbi:aldo/keto reductase [Herbiconiux moechotypicola]|uniref:Aldo/keto reductase n=1 Tax=Herbiconiux moechotypicola TaxID=637393 RepID=A0ABP5Q914_9MICO|nr:aldo/keto reductase [Herbiconiux moechotypicola]MCS5729310.1 aldo/keto reductase [Herbiconiux moechotypicola]
MSLSPLPSASAGGTFALGGMLPVARLGFGSMQLTGPNAFGPSRDAEGARAVLRRALELGVTLIDTADAYGPGVAETLIAEALHPYPSDLVIATKGGFVRGPRAEWRTDGHPAHLRAALEGSLSRLRLERIDLYQLHRIDHRVPLEDQIGALVELRDEGKIRLIGLSEITTTQLHRALEITPIATVQNQFNLADQRAAGLVDESARLGIGFIPWFPLATGGLSRAGGPLGELAAAAGVSPSQLALAWLLRRSSTMLPIPGTRDLTHLDDNVRAAAIDLDDPRFAAFTEAAGW